jgi:hypothetical protein
MSDPVSAPAPRGAPTLRDRRDARAAPGRGSGFPPAHRPPPAARAVRLPGARSAAPRRIAAAGPRDGRPRPSSRARRREGSRRGTADESATDASTTAAHARPTSESDAPTRSSVSSTNWVSAWLAGATRGGPALPEDQALSICSSAPSACHFVTSPSIGCGAAGSAESVTARRNSESRRGVTTFGPRHQHRARSASVRILGAARAASSPR